MKACIAMFAACVLLVSACASTAPAGPQAPPSNVKQWLDQQSRAKQGAIAGALVGALLGAVVARQTGHNVGAGAAAGGLVGGMAGFLIGRSRDALQAPRDEAMRACNYDPAQGYLARIEEVRFDPPQPRPGQTANLVVRYLVIGPNPAESIQVRMFRGVKYGDIYVAGAGPNEFTVPRGGGIVDSIMPVTLPAKAPHGTYGLEALIEDPQGRFPQTTRAGSLFVIARAPGGAAAANAS